MPIHIMAVDDEANTVNFLRLLIELEQPEWIFHGALDGDQALEIAANAPVDFVLLDISMPGMDGIEVCRRLRTLPGAAGMLIVMLTALDTPQRRQLSKEAGADGFWVKPFKTALIAKEIDRMIQGRAAQQLKSSLER